MRSGTRATCSCITELYEKWNTNADFSQNWGIFIFPKVFSIYGIINIAGRIINAATGGAGGAQRSVLRVRKHAVHGRARAAKTHYYKKKI
jgi:hypothetical protein